MFRSGLAVVALAAVVAAAMTASAAAQPVGPECPPYYNPFCCKGQFVNGECKCWSEQIFGEHCNYECRDDLCNKHGVCNAESNPVVDAQGNIVSGVCVCDASGEWFGDRCTGNAYNPTCTDGVRNGQETGIDCGGPDCSKCGGGQDCTQNSDCASGVCDNGKCTDVTCNDGVTNGAETDVDCGGGTCPKCNNGKQCLVNGDCLSGQCQGGTCVGDSAAPQWLNGTPRISHTDTSATLEVQISEPGVVYMCLVPDNSPAPTVAQIVAGTCPSALYATTIAMPDQTVLTKHQMPVVLTPDTHYDVYTIAADDRSPTPNFQTNHVKVEFKTDDEDVFPPQFWVLYPRIATVSDTSVTFDVALNEPGTVYYVIALPGGTAPTAAEVKAGSVTNVVTGTIPVGSAWSIIQKLQQGLTVDTQYVAYFAAEDSGNRLQADIITLPFTTSTDRTPPVFVDSYPTITGVTSSGWTVNVQLNEPGWFYVVVLPTGAPAPSSLQTVQGVDGSGNNALAHTSSQVATGSSTVMVNIVDMQDDTTYDVWVVASDVAINIMQTPVMRQVTTLADTQPPAFVATYPKITGITSHSATVEVQLDEPGKCYSVIVPQAAAAPTAAQVKAGYSPTAVATTSFDVLKSSTTYFGVFTGLAASTNYIAYTVCEDDTSPTPNVQATVKDNTVDTPADTFAPAFVAPSPSIVSANHNSGTLEVILDDVGTVYYVVLPRGATAPTQAELKAGTGSAGAASPSSGSFNVGSVLVKSSQVMGGLTKLTEYDCWVMTEDGVGNQGSPVKLEFRTTDETDTQAPRYSATYPKVHTETTSGATLAVRIDELGQTFFVVTLRDDAASKPTPAQIIAQQIASGDSALASGSMVITVAGVTFSEVITGLNDDTDYDLFIVSRDNVQPVPNYNDVEKLQFRTLPASSCSNLVKDLQESDVDCGGGACPKCINGKTCNSNTDCASNVCVGGVCVASLCESTVKDGDETDVDCGGATCAARCANGKACLINSDCASFNCDSNVCLPAVCTPCASDEITVSTCSANVASVCKNKAPVIEDSSVNTGNNVVTIRPETAGSYIIATRDCVTPSCSLSSTATTFDDAGVVKVIQTAAGATATFTLFDSALIRAVACKAGVQQSDEAITISKVDGEKVKVKNGVTLYVRALADFNQVRRDNFRASVAKTTDVDVADVSITKAVSTPSSPNDSTDVSYDVAIPSSSPAEALYHCNLVSSRINNVQGNGTLTSELLAQDVIVSGGGGGDNGGGGNGISGQEANETPALINFTGGWAWLWWLIPLAILLCLCCCLLVCCVRKRERERYDRHRHLHTHSIVPGGNRISPAPSNEEFAEDAELMSGPAARRAGAGHRLDVDDDDDLVGSGDDGADGDDDGEGEMMMDLTTVVQRGEVITTTIEGKGDPTFEFTGEGRGPSLGVVDGMIGQRGNGLAPPGGRLPALNGMQAMGSMSSMSSHQSMHSMHRVPSIYDDGSRPVGLDDLNTLNVRALSFNRNAPGSASYRSLSRHNTSQSSSGSVTSGLRVWANQ